MTCQELAAAIERLEPNAPPRDVARLCLLLANLVEKPEELQDDETLAAALARDGLRLQLATASTRGDEPKSSKHSPEATPNTFNRNKSGHCSCAIKVQSQILQLYVGDATIDV